MEMAFSPIPVHGSAIGPAWHIIAKLHLQMPGSGGNRDKESF